MYVLSSASAEILFSSLVNHLQGGLTNIRGGEERLLKTKTDGFKIFSDLSKPFTNHGLHGLKNASECL